MPQRLSSCLSQRSSSRRRVRAWTEPLEPRRLLSAGALDASFGQAGKIIAQFDPLLIPFDAVVQSDGRTVVVGRRTQDDDPTAFVLRLNVDGSPDADFGTITLDGISTITSTLLQPDGKIVMAGVATNDQDGQFAVVRLNTDGSYDNSFSGDGRALIDPPAGTAGQTSAMVRQPDGKLLIGGYGTVLRLTASGQVDTTFSGDGFASTGTSSSTNLIQSMFVSADGKIRCAPSFSDRPSQILLVRLTTAGQLDTTFSGDGRAYIQGGNSVDPQITSLPNNKAMLVNVGGNGDAIQIRRINTDGGLDTSFGTAGSARIVIPGDGPDFPLLRQSPGGKFVVAGFTQIDAEHKLDFFVTRFTADGAADAAFGDAGVVTFDAFKSDKPDALAVGPDGKVFLASLSFNSLTIDDFDYRTVYARLLGTDTEPSARITRTGTLLVQGSELAETITIDTTESNRVRVTLNGIATTFPARNVKRQAVFAGGGGDTIDLQSTIGASFEANGEGGNDVITGNGRNNVLRGGEGNDTLSGVGGDDALVGNAGNDSLLGGSGNDNLEGGSGNDTLFGANGQDTLNGGADTDTAIDPASDLLISIEN